MTPLLYLQEARKNLILRRGNKPTNPAEHGDGEADGEVCDVVGEDVGGVGDPDPALAALGEVDAVDADGEGGDDLERRERVDERGVGAVGGVADDGADGARVRAEELVAGRPRRGLPEAVQAAAAVQLLLQVRVHGVEKQHAQGLHLRRRTGRRGNRTGGGGRGCGWETRRGGDAAVADKPLAESIIHRVV